MLCSTIAAILALYRTICDCTKYNYAYLKIPMRQILEHLTCIEGTTP